MDTPSVPIHPEPVPENPKQVRWVFPPSTLGFIGQPRSVPGCLSELVTEGILLAGIEIEPEGVILEVAEGHNWRDIGPRVRTALQLALGSPEDWAPDSASDPDAILRAIAESVLAGDVGDFIRGHGGSLEIVSAHQDSVEVRFGGTCRGCVAREHTLSARFESALRRRHPKLVSVRVAP